METYLRPGQLQVPIEKLYPDPNNPRLALEDKPGYRDPERLFDEDVRQKIFGTLGESAYNVKDLVTAIVGQGWVPMDSIVVWAPNGADGRYVVLEGNRRRLALERLRVEVLPKETRKLERMQAKPQSYDTEQIEDQEEHVAKLREIVDDTEKLAVVEINADTVEELSERLPRVLAVRHITGPQQWGNYAADLWLLERFNFLFRQTHGAEAKRFWDPAIIKQVADEASLSATKTKWQLKSATWFSHFKAEWEEQLPSGEEFKKKDYFLFELIAKKPWVREQLQIGEDAFHIPEEMERTLFEWVFKLPRPGTGDENPNVFFRHQNIRLWDKMKRYDDKNGTGFASRFDPSRPEDAPTMHEVRAEYLSHRASREPHQVINSLLTKLQELKADDLAAQGSAFRVQLQQVRSKADQFLKMIEAAEA